MVATVEVDFDQNIRQRAETKNELYLVGEALTDLTLLYPLLTPSEQKQVDGSLLYLRGKRDQLRTRLEELEA